MKGKTPKEEDDILRQIETELAALELKLAAIHGMVRALTPREMETTVHSCGLCNRAILKDDYLCVDGLFYHRICFTDQDRRK